MATVQHANFIEYGRRGPRGAAQSNEESFDPELFGKSKTVSSMRGVKILQQSLSLAWPKKISCADLDRIKIFLS